MRFVAAAITVVASMPAFTLEPTDLVGTWEVIETALTDSKCRDMTAGSLDPKIWIVSVLNDGTIDVSVEGQTSYRSLKGRLSDDKSQLFLLTDAATAFQTSTGTGVQKNTATFTLSKAVGGTALTGVKRVFASAGGPEGPCFVDYAIEAKKH